MHRDIKPENIIVNEEEVDGQLRLVCKLCDFGSTRQDGGNVTKNVGTPIYKSPEYLRYDLGADNVTVDLLQNDIFSVGIIFFILLTNGKHPYLMNW